MLGNSLETVWNVCQSWHVFEEAVGTVSRALIGEFGDENSVLSSDYF